MSPTNPSKKASAKPAVKPLAQPRHIDNALLADGRLVRLTVHEERITHIVPMSDAPAADGALDLAGSLVLPALFDGHVHLDKTLHGLPWMPHAAGPTRASRIETELKLMPSRTLPTARAMSRARERM